MSDQVRLPVEGLQTFMVQVLHKAGVPVADGECVAANLIKADLWGVGTHGISRFPRYLMRLGNGTINCRPQISIQNTWPAVIAVDGDNGLGAVVGSRALQAAMDSAGRSGICVAGVRNSNHFGAAGYYCELAARGNYVALVLTNALAAMPPWGGKSAVLGTNPVAIGLPRKNKEPVVIDLATSVVARGKIIAAAKQGIAIPVGWALDEDGRPTTDPEAALKGMILPMAGPKGYALALAVDHLSGVFTGAAFGKNVASYSSGQKQANMGHLIIVMKADAFLGLDSYYERAEAFLQQVKTGERAAGITEIYLPGEREQNTEKQTLTTGVSVPAGLLSELKAISADFGVPLYSG
ncbi:hypothetical protein P22_2666 [Propionispora sp. 2/2-37]|uniref:Ldh family oxidoreductase n=1 Tax=Propionispora sp. 2/2-37 TaxID=1677858 RepID=UPI0006C7200F|nr:Ldh family oxidoreductase [Propionispora sp. 2/2-37]CUH96576.1 hypothetical protein P22_2666 [Propionispora sp. 2/2-37]